MPEDDPKQPDLTPEGTPEATPEEPSDAQAQSEPEVETAASDLEASETTPDPSDAEAEAATPEISTTTTAPSPQPAAQTTAAQPGVWEQARPVIKQQSIRVLRGTIWLLEKTVNALEAEPKPKPTVASRDRITTTSALGRQTTASPVPSSVAPPPLPAESAQPPEPDAEEPAARPSEPEEDTLKPLPERIWEIWVAILNLIRAYIPGGVANRIPNPILTGILVAIAIFLFSTISSLFSPAPAPELAEQPAPEPPVQVSPVPSPKVQPSEPPIAIAPSPKPTQAPSPKPQVSVKPTPTPTPISSPELELTPEQSLITAIQDQVAEVSDRYANGLIQSVQANFRDSRLIVRTSPGWYDLVDERQDQLANDLLKRANELDFSQLEVLDPADELVARSPVVGSRMVILQRSQPTIPTPVS